jgi:hypothetical protein
MKTTKLLLIALSIAAITASSAMARTGGTRTSASARTTSNTVVRSGSYHGGNHSNWGHRRHYRPRSSVYFGIGLGYPYGYGYGYPYYGSYPYGYGYRSRTVVYDAPLANDDSTVIAVQQRLARAGYYRGAIDGVMGPATRSAIRSYERNHGLRADGAIDRRLLATMGLA